MLAASLEAYNKRVEAGEVAPPVGAAQPSLPPAPPSLAGLNIGGPISQSLPMRHHPGMASRIPPRPRLAPATPDLSQLPILELPEPSPHSSSMLDSHPLEQRPPDLCDPGDEDEDEFVGGT